MNESFFKDHLNKVFGNLLLLQVLFPKFRKKLCVAVQEKMDQQVEFDVALDLSCKFLISYSMMNFTSPRFT